MICADTKRRWIESPNVIVLTSFFGICLGLIVLEPAIFRSLILRTATPVGFSEAKFSAVKVGQSADLVLAQLGSPFEFVVHRRSKGADWEYPLVFKDTERAKPFLAAGKKTEREIYVVLEYSRPKAYGFSFRARQIVIADGCVTKIDAYNFWDF